MWNSNGTLVIGRLEVDSMAHAQFLAKRWNTEDPLPEKKPRADRMTELVTKREEHAREMATKWAKKAQILKSQVKKANSRCAFWLRTVKYYEKKMAAKKAK